METSLKRKRKKKTSLFFKKLYQFWARDSYVCFQIRFRVCVNYLKTRKCLRFKIRKLLKIFISDLTYKMCLKKTSRTQVNASGKFPSKISSVYEFNTSLKNSILIFSKTSSVLGCKNAMPKHFSKQLSLLGCMNLEWTQYTKNALQANWKHMASVSSAILLCMQDYFSQYNRCR